MGETLYRCCAGVEAGGALDGRGRVRYWTFGERDWSQGESFALLEKMLKETPRAGS